MDKTGPVSFKVKLQDGKIIRCHQDQLRPCCTDDSELPLLNDNDVNMFPSIQEPRVSNDEVSTDSTSECRYPSRIHRPPTRYIEESDT